MFHVKHLSVQDGNLYADDGKPNKQERKEKTMTAYKKYLKLKGFTFNEDYLYLPWDNYQQQRETLEGCYAYISENNELVYVQCWDVGNIIAYFGRDGKITRSEFD